jgi:hypothetical protein
MKSLFVGLALATLCGSTAFADYYIVRAPHSHQCKIVEERPAPGAAVIIGAPFGVRVQAEERMRTVEVCRDRTEGRHRDHDTVIIDKR